PLEETPEARETPLGVRLALRSASSLVLISECGTCISRRIKLVNVSESPFTFLAESAGNFGIRAPRLERSGDDVLKSTADNWRARLINWRVWIHYDQAPGTQEFSLL